MDRAAVQLRESVKAAYSAAAEHPEAPRPFPMGREFAESLGYPAGLLASVPPEAVEAFTGVSDVSVWAELPQGATVLDLGCGGGLDAFLASDKVGPAGRVIGVDFSIPMLNRARACLAACPRANLLFVRAAAESLPLKNGSVDGVLINGIFNLNPARTSIFAEAARVLRPGGCAYAAELILKGPLPEEQKTGAANWFS